MTFFYKDAYGILTRNKKGFTVKTALRDALTLIISHVTPLKILDSVPLMKARGRICAQNIDAVRAIPPFDISLRDGRFIPLDKQGISLLHVKDLPLISTGEKVPEHCALIIESEELLQETITLTKQWQNLPSKEHIKCKGEDIQKGERLLKTGDRIGPFDITNLASQGVAHVPVLKEARIAYVGIGDELIDVQEQANDHMTYNSNAYTMAARGEMMGARTAIITHVKDTRKEIIKKLRSLKKYDAIITSGGMSTGDAMHQLLEDGTLTPLFKGVAMAPAGLTALSFLEETPILHLPGLPMACLLGFEVIGAALIRQLYGIKEIEGSIMTNTAQTIKYNPRSQSIVPGFFDGHLFFPERIAAGMLNVLNRCNGFILPTQDHPLEVGDPVVFHPFVSW